MLRASLNSRLVWSRPAEQPCSWSSQDLEQGFEDYVLQVRIVVLQGLLYRCALQPDFTICTIFQESQPSCSQACHRTPWSCSFPEMQNCHTFSQMALSSCHPAAFRWFAAGITFCGRMMHAHPSYLQACPTYFCKVLTSLPELHASAVNQYP